MKKESLVIGVIDELLPAFVKKEVLEAIIEDYGDDPGCADLIAELISDRYYISEQIDKSMILTLECIFDEYGESFEEVSEKIVDYTEDIDIFVEENTQDTPDSDVNIKFTDLIRGISYSLYNE